MDKMKLPVAGLLIVLLLMFQEPLSAKISFFSYCDEILALCGWGICLYHIIAYRGIIRIRGGEAKAFLCMILLIVLGFTGNAFSDVPRTVFDILRELLNLTKFWAVYLLMRKGFDQEYLLKLRKYLQVFFRILIVMATALLFVNLVINIGMRDEVRFGIPSYKFIYANCGSFSNYCVAMLAFSAMTEGKALSKYSIMSLLLLLSTLRFKALGVAAIYIIFAFGNSSGKIWNRLKWAVAGVGGLAVGAEQISNYFGQINTPRKLFLLYGIRIANDYFPLGSGIGTYGTSVASNHYSSIYHKYGLSGYWFFHASDTWNLMNDNFWPAIMAQYGWFGLVIYIYMLWSIFQMLKKQAAGDQHKVIAMNTIFVCIIIASLGGPILFGQYGALFFALLPIIVA